MKNFVRILSLALVAVLLGATLVSCMGFGAPNADPAKAEEALEKAEYLATKTDNAIAIGVVEESLDIEGLECIVSGVAKDNAISIYYFEDAKSAKKAFKAMEEKIDDILDDVDEKDVVAKCSGKMVYFGTKDAVKAAK